jgi:hypothetical protein
VRRRRAWLSAWTLGPLMVGGLIAAIIFVALGATIMTITRAQGACSTATAAIGGSGPSQVAGIPQQLLPIYEQAASRHQLGADGWAYLAAINYVETDFGHNLSTSSAGAVGWMQFMPESWRTYGVDANGDGTADPYDKWDAIFAAARLLRASGAPGSWPQAIFAYNHAGWYVAQVTARAQQYLTTPTPTTGTGAATASPAPTQGPAPGLLTDPGGVGASTIYGNNHDDNGHGAYQGESLAQDYASGSPPYAELGGLVDRQATLLGHLPPGTALQITNPLTGQSITAYKHDFGYGQGNATLQRHRYRIDLWWQTAYAIGIHDSALVQLQLVNTTAPISSNCQATAASVGTVPGATAKILLDGTAVAPADAPPAVQAMIAAGNRLIHFGYSWGGGHCVAAMNQQHPDPAGTCPGQEENGSPGYDCSSTVS